MIVTMKITKFILMIIVSVLLLSGCRGERDEDFTSPEGTHTVTVQYDFVSRPGVYYNGQKIFDYEKPGFNEEAVFYVEWLSEDEFLLKYDDPSHDGKYAEEYTIKLK